MGFVRFTTCDKLFFCDGTPYNIFFYTDFVYVNVLLKCHLNVSTITIIWVHIESDWETRARAYECICVWNSIFQVAECCWTTKVNKNNDVNIKIAITFFFVCFIVHMFFSFIWISTVTISRTFRNVIEWQIFLRCDWASVKWILWKYIDVAMRNEIGYQAKMCQKCRRIQQITSVVFSIHKGKKSTFGKY